MATPTRAKLELLRGARKILRLLGMPSALDRDKYFEELCFQARWAQTFAQQRNKVLEYWRRYRFFEEIEEIVRTRNKKCLDLGCGISSVLHFVQGEKFGVDPLAAEYRRLYAYPADIRLSAGAGEALPFADGVFDVVFCSNALDHVTDPLQTMHEIWRVLKPGAHLVLTVEVFAEPGPRDANHPHSFRREDVFALLGGKFRTAFERESTWIGLRNYVGGVLGHANTRELVLVGEKIRAGIS